MQWKQLLLLGHWKCFSQPLANLQLPKSHHPLKLNASKFSVRSTFRPGPLWAAMLLGPAVLRKPWAPWRLHPKAPPASAPDSSSMGGDPCKPEFIYKNLCIPSYMFKLQSPSKYSPFDAIYLPRLFSMTQTKFELINFGASKGFSTICSFVLPLAHWQNVSL